MKTIKLIKEQLSNFKGIASGNFAFNGENTEIVAEQTRIDGLDKEITEGEQ